MKKSPIYLGLLYILISATADAALPIFGKAAFHLDMEPASVLFLRNLFAFLILFIYALYRRLPVFSNSWLPYGQGIFLIAQELLFFYSMQYIDASVGMIVFYTYPVIVVLLAIVFFHEHPSGSFFIGLLIAITGVALISGLTSSTVVSSAGLMLAFLASVIFAFFSLLGQKTITEIHPFTLITTFSMIAIIVIVIIFPHDVVNIIYLKPEQILLGLGTAILNSLVGLVFFLKAIDIIGASRASIACTIEPVISILLANIIFHENLTPLQWLGALFVISSIALSVASSQKKQLRSKKQ